MTTTAVRKTSQVSLFGIPLDALTLPDAVEQLLQWSEDTKPCRYVVTPNVDHVVMLQENEALQKSYAGAGLILADGFPVVLASKLMGKPVPERVAGSDLVPSLLQAANGRERPLRVYLLGAAEGVADRAAEKIHANFPNVEVVGTYSPPLGFEHDSVENDAIIARINFVLPDILVLGLGAPKQELWIHSHCHRLQAKAALCVGATIDFLAGEKNRAPVWMQRWNLEWLHRICQEPRRMVRRYAKDAWIFPRVVVREWFKGLVNKR